MSGIGAPPTFEHVFPGKYQLQTLMRSMRQGVEQQQSDLTKGRLIEVELAGGTPAFPAHKLGRPYQGAFVVGQTVLNFVIVLTPDGTDAAGSDHTKYVGLTSASGGIVNLWVF